MLKKRFSTLLLTLTILLGVITPTIAQASEPIKLWINGNYVVSDVEPVIENDRTLVPIRVISENLGYEVDWDSESQIVNIASFNAKGLYKANITLSIGKTIVLVFDPDSMNKIVDMLNRGEITDDEAGKKFAEAAVSKEIDVAPKIIKERTMVPIRVVAEQLGVNVDWDSTNRTVVIGEGYATSKVEQKNETTPEVKTTSVETKMTAEEPLQGEVKANYIANSNTGKYHRAGCSQINKMLEEHKVGYETSKAAADAGYTACKKCNP